jgi:ribosomal protein L5
MTAYYTNRDFLFKAIKKNSYEIPSISSISLEIEVKQTDSSLFYSGLSFLTLVCDNYPFLKRLHTSRDKKKLGSIIGVSSYIKKQNHLNFLQGLSLENVLLLDLSKNSKKLFNNIKFQINSDFFGEYNALYQKYDKILSLNLNLTTSELSKKEALLFLSIWCSTIV